MALCVTPDTIKFRVVGPVPVAAQLVQANTLTRIQTTGCVLANLVQGAALDTALEDAVPRRLGNVFLVDRINIKTSPRTLSQVAKLVALVVLVNTELTVEVGAVAHVRNAPRGNMHPTLRIVPAVSTIRLVNTAISFLERLQPAPAAVKA